MHIYIEFGNPPHIDAVVMIFLFPFAWNRFVVFGLKKKKNIRISSVSFFFFSQAESAQVKQRVSQSQSQNHIPINMNMPLLNMSPLKIQYILTLFSMILFFFWCSVRMDQPAIISGGKMHPYQLDGKFTKKTDQ